jgi:hypothetical protein
VGLNSLKSLNLTNVYPNNKKKKNNKVKSKPLELYKLAGKKQHSYHRFLFEFTHILCTLSTCNDGAAAAC